ncbi:azurin [Kaistella solincola]|uniref:Azurin n=2 Tax=Kaistella solincola TaxID=510955 RepID=A0ABR4ZNN8_9FLAO|nr:azurin [Kaistella solincola]
MKRLPLKTMFVAVALSGALFTSCSDKKDTAVTTETTAAPEAAVEDEAAKQDTIKITLNANDKMQFDQTELNVYAGQTVELTLNHTGTMPKEAMGHNFTLLANGTDMAKFGEEAAKNKENDYLPTDMSSVLAHTDLIGGGESTTITFAAPEKGTYDFLCSFPGHYSIMKGKFNVK